MGVETHDPNGETPIGVFSPSIVIHLVDSNHNNWLLGCLQHKKSLP